MPGIIRIRNEDEPITTDIETAKKVDNRWNGFNGEEKARPAEQFKLGNTTYIYGDITRIKIIHEKEEENIPPLSEQERNNNLKMIQEIKNEFKSKGIFRANGDIKTGYGVTRTSMDSYKERHGKEYELTEGQYIIEDLEVIENKLI